MKLLTDTQNQILEFIKKYRCPTINQITEGVQKAKTEVRRNLLVLERRRVLAREWVPASRGRPQLAFKLTSESSALLFPNKEAELLEELVWYLKSNGHNNLVEDFFESYWSKKYQKVMEKVLRKNVQDVSSRLEVLAEVLEDEGFYPATRLSADKTKLNLLECHCPIEATSKLTDIPCKIEKRLIERVLQVE